MFSPVSLARDLNSDSRDRIVRVTLVLENNMVISLQCGSSGQRVSCMRWEDEKTTSVTTQWHRLPPD